MGKQAKRERKEEAEAAQAAQAADQGLSAEDRRFASTLNYLARGVVIGGSLGAIAGWIIPGAEMGRLVGLGLLAGCLAGVTLRNRNAHKEDR